MDKYKIQVTYIKHEDNGGQIINFNVGFEDSDMFMTGHIKMSPEMKDYAENFNMDLEKYIEEGIMWRLNEKYEEEQ